MSTAKAKRIQVNQKRRPTRAATDGPCVVDDLADIVPVKRMLVCGTCGSDHIVRDAWAFWSFERQEWELSDIFDHAFCLTCEEDCTIEETAAEPKAT